MSENLHYPWLVAFFLVALGGWFSIGLFQDSRSRRIAAVCSLSLCLCLSLGLVIEGWTRSLEGGLDPWDPLAAIGFSPLFRLHVLSIPLPALNALLWLIVVAVAPAATFERRRIRGLMLGLVVVSGMVTVAELSVMAGLWVASILLMLFDMHGERARGEHAGAFRVCCWYLGASALLCVGGVAALGMAGGEGRPGSLFEVSWRNVGVLCIFFAAMIRKGILPLHGWMPVAFAHGNPAASILFSAPQVGAYVATVVLLPMGPPELLNLIGVLSLLTAVYAAALSLVQRDPWRAFGFLFMSQSALVMTGLESLEVTGLTGSLTLWISSALALAGFGLGVWQLESQRGKLRLDRLNGGHRSMPLMATCFLLLGLASVGFPGTLGFVGQELLVDGATSRYPGIGFAVVVATALNGLCVVRMYFSLFLGPVPHGAMAHFRTRKTGVLAGLALLLFLAGLMPRNILDSRSHAARQALAQRNGHMGGRP